jgi:hypothetical protein
MGSGTVNSVSPSAQKIVIIGSPFMKCGKAELLHASLHITYEAFKETHDVYIGMADLDQLIRSRFAPAAPVKECRKEQDDTETAVKIGYACRTTSGKALKINTIHSAGDLLLPWSNLLDIVSHKRNSAPVSRIVVPEAPRAAPTHKNIREGLVTGF